MKADASWIWDHTAFHENMKWKWYLNNANIAQGLAGCGWVQRLHQVRPWDWTHPCWIEQVAEDTRSELLANTRKMALEQACVRMEGHVIQTLWEGPEVWLYHLHQRAGPVEGSCWAQEILERRPSKMSDIHLPSHTPYADLYPCAPSPSGLSCK